MAQNTCECLSIGGRIVDSANSSLVADIRRLHYVETDIDSFNSDVYQFQAPKPALVLEARKAKLCQISPVKTENESGCGFEAISCHAHSFHNGNSPLAADTARIMGANHSYSLKSRQEMRKNGDEKFNSSDDLCSVSVSSQPSHSQSNLDSMSHREMAPLPATAGTKENGQYSYAYSEAKCNTTPRSVRLGDYTEPVDSTNFTWGHKTRKSTTTDVYTDPYEPRRLSENLRQSPSWKRRMHPAGGVFYELAQTPEVIYDHPPSRHEETDDEVIADDEDDNPDDHSKAHQDTKKSKQKLPENSKHAPPKKSPAEIDFKEYELAKAIDCEQKHSYKIQESAMYSLSADVKQAKTMPIKNGHTDDPLIYDEPWDTKQKQIELQNKIQRAHSRTEDHAKIASQLSSPSSSSTSSISEKRGSPDIKLNVRSPSGSSANTYEDAWDLPKKQQQLQDQLRIARLISNPAPTNNYEDAWDTPERISQVQQKIQRAMSHEGPPTTKPPGRPTATETEMYSEPWDLIAKQRELQEKLQAPHIRAQRKQSQGSLSAHSTSSQMSVGSSGSPSSPTRRNVYPDSRYDEQVDHHRSRGRSSSSTKSSQSMSPSSGGSPTHRGRPLHGNLERVNPLIPVDCQSWYHGNISRNDAESILRVCKEGSFLVRDSESDKGQKSLSLKSNRMNIHVKIILKSNGTYILGENSRDFNSIPEMIDYYTSHLLPLKGAEHISLIHPVDCKFAEQRP